MAIRGPGETSRLLLILGNPSGRQRGLAPETSAHSIDEAQLECAGSRSGVIRSLRPVFARSREAC
jgi:hypothetical protein